MVSHKTETVMGMNLEIWRHESCEAQVAEGPDWATIYVVESADEGKGHAQELLAEAKKHYEGLGHRFGGSVALNSRMRHIYQKLKINEYFK
jgi:hypothetical protein